MTEPEGAFYKDVRERMQDPEYRLGSVIARHRVATVVHVLRTLDEARDERGLSKAAIGRMLDMTDSGVRRLFTSAGANPTLETLADLATALGYRVRLEPLSPEEITEFNEASAHVQR